METAVFGGGCFWCLEAIFNQLKGVSQVTSGYAGGHLPNPTYERESSGRTGHAEVFRVEEQRVLRPAPTSPYDLPVYATAKVHRDHHIEVAKALYSIPGNLIGQRVDVREGVRISV